MMAISIRQPFAELVVSGIKPSENRGRNTSYRGPLLLHAAKKFEKNWQDTLQRAGAGALTRAQKHLRIRAIGSFGAIKWYPGCIIGVAFLTKSTRTRFSDFCEPGAWHYKILYPERFVKPFPVRGYVGLFNVSIKNLHKADYNLCCRMVRKWNQIYNQQLPIPKYEGVLDE